MRREALKMAGIEVQSAYGDSHEKLHTVYPICALEGNKCHRLQDTHYNGIGQWIVIKHILKELSIDSDEFVPKYETRQMTGDLGAMIGRESLENVVVFSGFCNHRFNTNLFNNKNALKGNTGHLAYHINTKAKHKKRILIFGDSFFLQCLGQLDQIFQEIIYIRNSYLLEDVISSTSPDIVLSGIAERYLFNYPSASKSLPFFTRYFSQNFEPQALSKEFIEATNALFSPRSGEIHTNWLTEIC